MKDDDLTAAYMAGFERGKEMTASERAKLELFDAMVETLRAAFVQLFRHKRRRRNSNG
jgi:hypothetical protein